MTDIPTFDEQTFVRLQSYQDCESMDISFSPRCFVSPFLSPIRMDRECAEPSETQQVPIQGKRKGTKSKFPEDAVNEMSLWLMSNMENPYPPMSLKLEWSQKYKISPKQISTFLVNKRHRLGFNRKLQMAPPPSVIQVPVVMNKHPGLLILQLNPE